MAELPSLLVRVVFVVAALGLWQWAAPGIVTVMADWPAWDLKLRVRLVMAAGWIVIVARATSSALRAARARRAAASVRIVGEPRMGGPRWGLRGRGTWRALLGTRPRTRWWPLALGVRITQLDVIAAPGRSGQLVPELRPGVPYWQQMWEVLVVAMAGSVEDVSRGVMVNRSEADFTTAVNCAVTIVAAQGRPVGYRGALRIDDLLAEGRTVAGEILATSGVQVEEITRRLVATGGLRHLVHEDLVDVRVAPWPGWTDPGVPAVGDRRRDAELVG